MSFIAQLFKFIERIIMAENDYKNIICFINPKSGRKLGVKVYDELTKLLGEECVFDLRDGGPKKGYVTNLLLKEELNLCVGL